MSASMWLSLLLVFSSAAWAAGENCGLEGTTEEKLADCAQKRPQDFIRCAVALDFSSHTAECENLPMYRQEGFGTRVHLLVTYKDAPLVWQTIEQEGEPRREPVIGERACFLRPAMNWSLMGVNCENVEALRKDRFTVHSWTREAQGDWSHELSQSRWSQPILSVGNAFSAFRICRGKTGKFTFPECRNLSYALSVGLSKVVALSEARNGRLWCQDGERLATLDLENGGFPTASPFDGAGLICGSY